MQHRAYNTKSNLKHTLKITLVYASAKPQEFELAMASTSLLEFHSCIH